MHSDRKLQAALNGTRTAKTKLSQVEFALGNIIDRDIQINTEYRGVIIDLGKLRADRTKRDAKDRENQSIAERQQRIITECLDINQECIRGLERSRGYLDGDTE